VLDGEAHAALAAIVPAMLGSALPQEAPARAMPSAAPSPAWTRPSMACRWRPQQEVQELVGLLALAPARRSSPA
jgi:hypothetical protein